MLVTSQEMKTLEEQAFAKGASPEGLMDEAGAGIAAAIQQFFPFPGKCIVHFGKGHNGGDGLVAARHLSTAGWVIEPVPAFSSFEWSPLTRKKFHELNHPFRRPQSDVTIVIDALLGIGSGGGLRQPVSTA